MDWHKVEKYGDDSSPSISNESSEEEISAVQLNDVLASDDNSTYLTLVGSSEQPVDSLYLPGLTDRAFYSQFELGSVIIFDTRACMYEWVHNNPLSLINKFVTFNVPKTSSAVSIYVSGIERHKNILRVEYQKNSYFVIADEGNNMENEEMNLIQLLKTSKVRKIWKNRTIFMVISLALTFILIFACSEPEPISNNRYSLTDKRTFITFDDLKSNNTRHFTATKYSDEYRGNTTTNTKSWINHKLENNVLSGRKWLARTALTIKTTVMTFIAYITNQFIALYNFATYLVEGFFSFMKGVFLAAKNVLFAIHGQTSHEKVGRHYKPDCSRNNTIKEGKVVDVEVFSGRNLIIGGLIAVLSLSPLLFMC
ncbi:hypothetical protein O9G_000279 [Rozella allomycis CSF55]|uniref:Uncharacterized protein n=1 Tax=Rozella allomycis (strain CSF55) TaxID=988480 RepID=A0A075ASU8_ROZAC|nr:hypothetical protein O9G_000279 [Rozella allomycis CSF55]|eukprot:EPZ31800.1 hypothetical protein O9G_000279 [Rozella allomycis CSF55]